MNEITNTRSTLMPFPEAKMEQSKEWCDKHQCKMVKIVKTGAVICPQCNKEERLEFEEQKAQASFKRNEEMKRLYYLKEFSLMDSELKNATFDNFKVDTAERQADLDFIKKEAREYIKGAQNNIVLIGDCGVGKSHLAYSAIKAISDYNKKLATVINVVDLVAKVKEDFSLESYYTNLLSGKDKHDQIEYLVLDDLGTEKTSEWSSNLIYSILNKRTNTIITTNLTPPEIQRRYGKRIFSRIFKGVGQEHVYQFKNRTDERMNLWN
ncbi:ATP-binding protein [Streptococcus lutetiensis]|uniref:ATP-binding protein n=1 Tax=Streptococcus lutetiensis TaxID=150055 RepID=UPI0022DF37D9|nr:ATP-binding protein [Streptococcus lutetiensis]